MRVALFIFPSASSLDCQTALDSTKRQIMHDDVIVEARSGIGNDITSMVVALN